MRESSSLIPMNCSSIAERPDKGMIAFLFELEDGYTCHFRDIRGSGMIVIGRKFRPLGFSLCSTWKLSIKSATYYKDMSDLLICGTTVWSTQIGMNVSPACTTLVITLMILISDTWFYSLYGWVNMQLPNLKPNISFLIMWVVGITQIFDPTKLIQTTSDKFGPVSKFKHKEGGKETHVLYATPLTLMWVFEIE